MDRSQLSPTFIIPKGSQVVLTKDLQVSGAHKHADGSPLYKKSGSVGEVTDPPLTNEYPYLVRFADGHTVSAKRHELTVRRSDAPEDHVPKRELAAFEPHVFYKVLVGSRAFGLADEQSDEDERGVYLPPADWHWSLQPLPEQIEFKRMPDGRWLDHNEQTDGDDVCWWELEKFLRLALKANPNVLEVLYVPESCILHADVWGQRLRALAPSFLSKYLYQTYSGYVLSQFRKMKRELEKGRAHRPKHAMHLIRLLYSGITALQGQGILVDVGPYRDELLRIKREQIPFDVIFARALELDARFQDAYNVTALPDRPDVEAVDRFLIEARKSRAE
ncbi:MAG: nucleotidyltransferase domain-containing protein [Planctomycetes bacterium]|nr:nucleotidyltransferase domain-containing protein [Planctomycetota bacterium]